MRLVVDASVALKWVVAEAGSMDAALRHADLLLAPDLIVTECSNALWKKARRGELGPDEALLAARGLSQAPLELRPMRGLTPAAMDLALRLDHPAYDCFYLALAAREDCPFVTADVTLARKVAQSTETTISILSLEEAATLVGPAARP